MSERDGGPAFPLDSSQALHASVEAQKADPLPEPEYIRRHVRFLTGMSLRDWFAGMALQGQVVSREACGREGFGYRSIPEMAAEAYKIADAMIAARGGT